MRYCVSKVLVSLAIALPGIGVSQVDGPTAAIHEDMANSVGSKTAADVSPTTWSSITSPPTGPMLLSPFAYPTNLSFMTCQGYFGDKQASETSISSDEHKVLFAERFSWLRGTSFSGFTNIWSGPGVTRPTANQAEKDDFIASVGGVNQAILSQGGTAYDQLTATGHFMMAYSALKDFIPLLTGTPLEDASGAWYETPASINLDPSTDTPRHWKWFVQELKGSETPVVNQRRISRETMLDGVEGQLAGPIDGRYIQSQEDDLWDTAPSVVKFSFGQQNLAQVDTGAMGSGGTIENAIAQRNYLASDINGSWIDVFYATGVRVYHGLIIYMQSGNTTPTPDTPDNEPKVFSRPYNTLCTDTISGQTVEVSEVNLDEAGIDDWASIEVLEPWLGRTTETVKTKSKVGVFIEDQNPVAAGGSPLLVPELAGEPFAAANALSVEKTASIVTRGNLFSSVDISVAPKTEEDIPGLDSNDDLTYASHYAVQTAHIRDILHLTPRVGPPEFLANLPLDEQLGVLYFDAAENRLMITVNIGNQAVPCQLELDTSSDAGFDAKDDAAKAAAADGTSLYLPPRVTAVSEGNGTCNQTFSVDLTGFAGISGSSKPLVYWRRVGYGARERGRHGWEAVSSSGVTVATLGTGHRISFQSPFTEIEEGEGPPVEGQTIQLMVLRPDSKQAAGYSFEYAANLAPAQPGTDLYRIRNVIFKNLNYAPGDDISGDTRVDVGDYRIASQCSILSDSEWGYHEHGSLATLPFGNEGLTIESGY